MLYVPFSCRPSEYPYWFGMLTPFGVIYLFNWALFIIIMISITRRTHRASKLSVKETSVLAQGRKLTLIAAGLSIVFGLGWGIGVIALITSVVDADSIHFAFEVCFSILVGLHGLLIFLFHGVFSQEVREVWKSWLSRLPCISYQYRKVWYTSTNTSNSAFDTRAHRSSLIEASVVKHELRNSAFASDTTMQYTTGDRA